MPRKPDASGNGAFFVFNQTAGECNKVVEVCNETMKMYTKAEVFN